MMRLLDNLFLGLTWVAGLSLIGVVLITFLDVILRYFFASPISGRQDLVEMGMVVTVMCAAPYAWRRGAHIVVDVFPHFSWAPAELVREYSVRFIVTILFIALSWHAYQDAENATLFNEATNMIGIPHRPFMLLISIISAFHALLIVIESFTTQPRPFKT